MYRILLFILLITVPFLVIAKEENTNKKVTPSKTVAKTSNPVAKKAPPKPVNKVSIPLETSTPIFLETYQDYPKILNANDVKKYNDMLLAIKKEDYKKYKELEQTLENRILLGYARYNLYVSPNYKSSASELSTWLKDNKTMPSIFTKRIYLQANRKIEKQNLPTIYSDSSTVPIYMIDDIYLDLGYNKEDFLTDNYDVISSAKYASTSTAGKQIEARLNSALRKGQTKIVSDTLKDPKTISTLARKRYYYYASRLAQGYFFDGQDEFSTNWNNIVKKNMGDELESPWYIQGLIEWRRGNYDGAVENFKVIALNNKYDIDTISASAFWASRASLSLGKIDDYEKYLKIASKDTTTFYGLIAAGILGINVNLNWQDVDISDYDLTLISNDIRGRRAFALIQLGLGHEAELEMMNLAVSLLEKDGKTYNITDENSKRTMYSIIYVAQKTPMPFLSYRLGGSKGIKYGLNTLSYPISPWYRKDDNGYIALVHAIMRRESNFNITATSWVGASGVMQIMPGTAQVLTRNMGEKNKNLYNPLENVELGEYYINQLLQNSNDNLIFAIAGWNGGSLNVNKWSKQSFRKPEDPLFFLESIPFRETRNFTKAVLLDYWIYQYRFSQDPSSMINLAKNEYPIFSRVEVQPSLIAKVIDTSVVNQQILEEIAEQVNTKNNLQTVEVTANIIDDEQGQEILVIDNYENVISEPIAKAKVTTVNSNQKVIVN